MPKQNGFIFGTEQKLYRLYKCGLGAILTSVWMYGVLDQVQNPVEGRFYTGVFSMYISCFNFRLFLKPDGNGNDYFGLFLVIFKIYNTFHLN